MTRNVMMESDDGKEGSSRRGSDNCCEETQDIADNASDLLAPKRPKLLHVNNDDDDDDDDDDLTGTPRPSAELACGICLPIHAGGFTIITPMDDLSRLEDGCTVRLVGRFTGYSVEAHTLMLGLFGRTITVNASCLGPIPLVPNAVWTVIGTLERRHRVWRRANDGDGGKGRGERKPDLVVNALSAALSPDIDLPNFLRCLHTKRLFLQAFAREEL